MTYQEFQERYEYHPVDDRIGKGGYGIVYKAYDNYHDRYVAIKMAEVIDEDDTTRLAHEVELVAQLPAHPNIAHYEECYTFNTPTGRYDFGILQYYKEGSLDTLVSAGKLSQADKEDILLQVLEGIRFLHNHDIIHRDLKPRNILIARRGSRYIPKITDFGISKVFDAGDSSSFANSLVGAGTLAYSSPEQLGERTMHRNADLWSYGVIVCQLFTGELPFTTGGLSPSSIEGRNTFYRQIMSGKLPPLIDKIPEPWQALVRRLLVIDTRERLRNCDAVKAFLANGKESQSAEPHPDDNDKEDKTRNETSTPPASPIPDVDKDVESTRRESTPQPVKPVVKPATPKAEPVVSSTPKKEVPPTTVQEDRPKSKKSWIWIGAAVVAVLLGILLLPKSQPAREVEEVAVPDNFVEQVNGVVIPMVYVPGGTFTMGGTSEQGSDAKDREKPTHQVTLDGYYIGATEVTQAQWEAVMGTTLRQQRDKADPSWSLYGEGGDYPMYYVNYDEVLEFCRRLSGLTGKHYTLPTEAQWEYAARGGRSGGTKYSGCNTIGDVAWYDGNCNEQTHPVGTKSPNALGLYDMSGNVWEWCLDRDGYYSSLAQTNPQGPADGDHRMVRGGSWCHSAEYCRVSKRGSGSPSNRDNFAGFRVVLL